MYNPEIATSFRPIFTSLYFRKGKRKEISDYSVPSSTATENATYTDPTDIEMVYEKFSTETPEVERKRYQNIEQHKGYGQYLEPISRNE